MNKTQLLSLLITCTALSHFGSLTFADTIFDNSHNDLLIRFDPGTFEVGDEIQLSGDARYLTNFAFEFWGEGPISPDRFAGDVQARVRFYENNGPDFHGYATPGSLFFDSGWFTLDGPTPRNTLVFVAGEELPASGLFIPVGQTMTWSVQFQRAISDDSVGVDIYSPVSTGASFPDYWENDGTGWQLKNNIVPMDFAARLEASLIAVPEPSVLALWVLAGGVCFWCGRRRLAKKASSARTKM
ncbi:MAG TPA: PEP-CTERM sorting domain-containing protein [Candidatus Limnocylindrales bacterium]|nr:PEP-CTERM sorting domain-containing protein [Candidatus Limnocylindrales bacterium]